MVQSTMSNIKCLPVAASNVDFNKQQLFCYKGVCIPPTLLTQQPPWYTHETDHDYLCSAFATVSCSIIPPFTSNLHPRVKMSRVTVVYTLW